MVELTFCILPNLEDHRVEAIAYPADGAVLNRKVRAPIGLVRMKENFLRLLEADSAPWIPPKSRALPLIEVETHYGITVIP
jgi:hypothetical protein